MALVPSLNFLGSPLMPRRGTSPSKQLLCSGSGLTTANPEYSGCCWDCWGLLAIQHGVLLALRESRAPQAAVPAAADRFSRFHGVTLTTPLILHHDTTALPSTMVTSLATQQIYFLLNQIFIKKARTGIKNCTFPSARHFLLFHHHG